MKKLMTTLALALLSLAAFSQENQFYVDAQLRTRAEYNNGALAPRVEGTKPAFYINERARIGVGYQYGILELKAAVQHTGIWGQSDINAGLGNVAINEAWAKLKSKNGWFLQLGRQQLVYDDERILGGLDWHVSGNWHDALKMGYESKAHKIHAIAAFNQARANVKGGYYDGPMPYKFLGGAWYHFQADQTPFGLSLIFLDLGWEAGTAAVDAGTNHMQTLGTDITFKPSGFDFHAAAYYQMGKNIAGTPVSAWMASAKAGYQLNRTWGMNLGYDYRSGHDGSSTSKAFDQLFGTHHKFYGFMDYFLRTVSLGLQDVQAGVICKASQKASLLLNYHYFATAQPAANGKKGLGHEIDLQATISIMKNVTLMAGYSTMLGTETMDLVKGGSHKAWQDWLWIQLNINPRVFFTKW